jgi:hypothetical protein
MTIWQSCIAKYSLAIWRYFISKCLQTIWQHPIAKHTLAILVTSYCLHRNDRVSSFYWARASKLCLVTSFSYFSRYFLILIFLQNCYSLNSLRLSWLQGNPISCPVSRTAGTPNWYVVHVPPYFWHRTHGFLEVARGNLVVDSLLVIFSFSAFCRRFLMQTSIGRMQIIPFLLTKILKLTIFCMI